MTDTKKTVTLFIQCLVDGIYPEVGEAMVKIFHKLGINMSCPPQQTCCGQPAFNAGYRREAGIAAKRFIEIFETADTIVCPSGSCVTMVRHHYPQLFEKDALWLERAKRVAAKTYELTEYLVDILGVDELGARYDGKITYHDSCHLCAISASTNSPADCCQRCPEPNSLKCTIQTGVADSADHFRLSMPKYRKLWLQTKSRT